MEREGTFHQNTEQMETREKHIQQRILEKVSKRGAFLAPFRAHWDVDAETLGLDTGDYNNNTHNDIYKLCDSVQFSSVAQSFLSLCNPMDCSTPRPPCPSPTPRVYSNSCPLSWWWHPTISSSVAPFSSCPQSFPASGSFPISHFFASGGQSIGVPASASVLPMNIQDWFPWGWTGWISLQSKGLSRVFSNTTVQKHQFFRAQLSL